jgi:hypothetical protein
MLSELPPPRYSTYDRNEASIQSITLETKRRDNVYLGQNDNNNNKMDPIRLGCECMIQVDLVHSFTLVNNRVT